MFVDIPNHFIQFRANQDAARQMMQTLGSDCHEYLQLSLETKDQIYRRAYVRAVFAFIEGMVYCQKMSTINLGLLFGEITVHELVALEDITLGVNDKGDVSVHPTYPRFLNNIKFAFKVYSKSLGSEFQLNLKGVGWESLRKAVKVRDRLMHPKEIHELYGFR